MYRFVARSSAPIQYLDADAKRLLEIVGKDTAAPGIITRTQLAAAIAAIDAAIAREEAPEPQPEPASAAPTATAQDADGDEAGAKPAPIALRNRAMPLLRLLREAASADEDVVWEAR